jgi:hypothetical protein
LADECVGEDEQFAGDGDEGKLGGLAAVAEALSQVFEGGVASSGAESGHVKGAA